MKHQDDKIRFVIASDVDARDGIGIEVLDGNELLIEVFRNDTTGHCEITLFRQDMDLQLVEQAIRYFRDNITDCK